MKFRNSARFLIRPVVNGLSVGLLILMVGLWLPSAKAVTYSTPMSSSQTPPSSSSTSYPSSQTTQPQTQSQQTTTQAAPSSPSSSSTSSGKLPNAGPGSVFGIAALIAILSSVGHYLFRRRRNI